MTLTFDKQRFTLYLRIAFAFLLLVLFRDLVSFPLDTFFKRVINNLWLISYLIFLNFILFEYTIPYFKLNVKRIVLGVLFLVVLLMGYTYAFYG